MANPIFAELRESFDGSDPFMTKGHQIIKIRKGWRKKQIPEWATSDKAIQKLVLRSFPKLKTNDKQRQAAGKWVHVINLYFRMGWTRGQAAEEMHLTPKQVKDLIQSIRRVAAGQRANGTGVLGALKGRPKKRAPNSMFFGR